ncbi:MAG: hypothetical protein L0Y58_05750 [Verrucomicrobia subdivision 3 bacterium]|nr:hypothetical protein [Limisphaerales bacterium]
MPELAEVEFYRRQWRAGEGRRVISVEVHATKRVFRNADASQILTSLPGGVFRSSVAHGKQMLFRFGAQCWLTIHLGMSGKLRVEPAGFRPGKHDHLALRQKERTLVYSDPRQFGRIAFHRGAQPPDWWINKPPAPNEPGFTLGAMTRALNRHRKLAIKAALLLQNGFPGIGNWMADEILWQAGIAPGRPAAKLSAAEVRALWQTTRSVSRRALRTIGKSFDAPPRGWLFHERWSRAGKCPKHRIPLRCATIGGRTTAWCKACQR